MASDLDLLEQLRKFVIRAQTSADGRPMVIYFLRQPERIGQITHELFMLKGVYSPVDHQVFVAHPRAQPRGRHFSQDSYNIAMRDLIPLEARDEMEDRVCYANIRDPFPMPNSDPPLTLILGSEPAIARQWFARYGRSRDGYPIHWLTEVEKQRGERLGEKLGIGKDMPVVVLHVREQGLLRLAYETHRNADIARYERAIRLLLDRGHAVIRIGDPYCKPLPFKADGLIDTPFLDFYDRIGDPYFVSRCAFMINSYSGPAMLATAFNRPTLAVNVMPQDMTTMTDEVVVYKEYRPMGGRAMTLAEIDRAGLMNAIAEHFAAAGCESAENDSDLLHDAVLEMLERQAGRFTPSPALIEANAKLDAFGRARHEIFRQDSAHFMGYSLLGLHGRQSLSEAFLARYPNFMDQIEADGSVASNPQ